MRRGPDPGDSAYEAARERLAVALDEIGRDQPASRFAEMAADLRAGDLMHVQTWVVLQVMVSDSAISTGGVDATV